MDVCVEDSGDTTEGDGHADGADQKEGFAADLIDEAHAEEGGQEVNKTDAYGLQRGGVCAESGGGEDVVGVIEDCVDAGELIEEAYRDGEEDRQVVFPVEERLLLRAALHV